MMASCRIFSLKHGVGRGRAVGERLHLGDDLLRHGRRYFAMGLRIALTAVENQNQPAEDEDWELALGNKTFSFLQLAVPHCAVAHRARLWYAVSARSANGLSVGSMARIIVGKDLAENHYIEGTPLTQMSTLVDSQDSYCAVNPRPLACQIVPLRIRRPTQVAVCD